MQTETAIQTDSILAQLKARTAHQHQQTEDGVDLMRDDFSLAEYKNLLVRFYAFYKSYEEKMRDAQAKNPIDFNYRGKIKHAETFCRFEKSRNAGKRNFRDRNF